jgi:hypothetical protein
MTATLLYDTTDKQGSRSLTVSADPDNSITESNENDNTVTVTIPIGEGEGGGEGDPPSGEPGSGTPSEPSQPDDPGENGATDDEASTDALEGRDAPPDPSLNVELAEDLNLRD